MYTNIFTRYGLDTSSKAWHKFHLQLNKCTLHVVQWLVPEILCVQIWYGSLFPSLLCVITFIINIEQMGGGSGAPNLLVLYCKSTSSCFSCISLYEHPQDVHVNEGEKHIRQESEIIGHQCDPQLTWKHRRHDNLYYYTHMNNTSLFLSIVNNYVHYWARGKNGAPNFTNLPAVYAVPVHDTPPHSWYNNTCTCTQDGRLLRQKSEITRH